MAAPEKRFPAWDTLPPALRGKLDLTQGQFERIHAALAEREIRAPAVGSPAPDFELKRIDEKGALTEQTLRLSDLRGRPVALVFGSYT